MDLNKHYFCNFSFSFVSKFHGGVSKITKMYAFEPRRLVSDQNRAHLCEHEAGRGAAGAPRPPRAPRGFRARIGVARLGAHGREAVTLLAPRTQSRRRPRARLRLPPRPAAAAVRSAVWRSSVPAPCCTRLPWLFVFLSMDLHASAMAVRLPVDGLEFFPAPPVTDDTAASSLAPSFSCSCFSFLCNSA